MYSFTLVKIYLLSLCTTFVSRLCDKSIRRWTTTQQFKFLYAHRLRQVSNVWLLPITVGPTVGFFSITINPNPRIRSNTKHNTPLVLYSRLHSCRTSVGWCNRVSANLHHSPICNEPSGFSSSSRTWPVYTDTVITLERQTDQLLSRYVAAAQLIEFALRNTEH